MQIAHVIKYIPQDQSYPRMEVIIYTTIGGVDQDSNLEKFFFFKLVKISLE